MPSRKRTKKSKHFIDFIKYLDNLDKCRIKKCSRHGMSKESDKCVKKKCSRKLKKINRKYNIRKKSSKCV